MEEPCVRECLRGHGTNCIAIRTKHRRYCAQVAVDAPGWAQLVDRLSLGVISETQIVPRPHPKPGGG